MFIYSIYYLINVYRRQVYELVTFPYCGFKMVKQILHRKYFYFYLVPLSILKLFFDGNSICVGRIIGGYKI